MAEQADPRRLIAAALAAERWSDALALLERWCLAHPGDARGWFNRGFCLFRLGRLVEAVPCLERAVQLDPALVKATALRDHLATRRRASPDEAPATLDGRVDASLGGGRPAPAAASDGDCTLPRLDGATLAPAPIDAATVCPQPTCVDAVSLPPLARTGGAPVLSVATTFTSAANAAWEKGAVVAGRYEVRDLARGGMGVVYMAWDRELDRMVAVKTPLPAALASADGRARFFREAEAWVALGIHPNICSAYYIQELGGVPRLFVEYVDGGDLDGWLKRRELSLEQRFDIAIQVARGMHHTHTLEWSDERGKRHRGLVHRDLKPANVLMSSEGVARVTDFGLVRAEGGLGASAVEEGAPGTATLKEMLAGYGADDEVSGSWRTVTAAGGVLGTPPYVAPEIWSAATRAGGPSDIYAYGCLLYEILCGRRPFVVADEVVRAGRQAQLVQWLKLHLKEAPPDARRFVAELDPAVAELMLACLAKAPEQRPASFAEIRDTLTAAFGRQFGPYPRPEPYRALLVADALNNSAVSYMTLGHAARAERSWRAARSADPLHPEATFNLALHEWIAHGLTDAELHRRLEEVVAVGTASWRERHLYGKVHLLLDEPVAAAAELSAAVTAGVVPLQVLRDLGLALVRAARLGDEAAARRAVAILERLLALAPGDHLARVALAAAHDLLGDETAASTAWAAAVAGVVDPPGDRRAAYCSLVPGFERRASWRQPAEVDALAVTVRGEIVVRAGGRRIAVIGSDGTVRTTFSIVGGAKRGRSLVVTADGTSLVAAGEGVSLATWELASGRDGRRFRSQPGYVTTVAVNRAGSEVLTGGSDRVVRRFTVADGACVSELRGHDAFVTVVAFSADGARAFTVGGDGALREWRLDDGECLRTIAAHRGTVSALAVADDGALAVTGGEDGEVRFWDLHSGGLRAAMKGHSGRVAVVAVAPATGLLVSGGDDGTVRCWSLDSGAALAVVRFRERVNDLAVGDDGRWVAVAHGPVVERVELGHVAALRPPFSLTVPLTAGELERRQGAFEHEIDHARRYYADGDDDRAMAAATAARAVPGYDQHPQVLAVVAGVLARRPRTDLRSWMEHASRGLPTSVAVVAAVSSRGERVVVATAEAPLRCLDLTVDEAPTQLSGHQAPVLALALDHRGAEVAAATRRGTLVVWSDGAEPRSTAVGEGELTALARDPLGQWWVAGDGDGRVTVVGRDGTVAVLGRHREAVTAVAVSPDGRLAASASWDQTIILWELERRLRLQVLEGHEQVVRAVAMSPDGRALASAGGDGAIRLWATATGRCLRTLGDERAEISVLAFTPDGRFVLSGDRDGRLRLWDQRTAACVRVVDGHTSPIVALACDPSAERVVSVAAKGSIRVWRLEWVPELAESGPSLARVKPFFEVFLGLRARGLAAGEAPVWSDAELAELVADLARRGFGQVEPGAARAQLTAMAAAWSGHHEERQVEAAERHRVQSRQEHRAPLLEATRTLTRNLGLKILGAVAVVAAAVGLVLALRPPANTTISFDDLLFEALRADHQSEARSRQTRGLVFAFHAEPGVLAAEGEVPCLRDSRSTYFTTFAEPEQLTTACPDAALECPDQAFLDAYHLALVCLPAVADDELLGRLLALAGEDLPVPRRQDLRTVLVQAGPPAVPHLAAALGHPVAELRHTAAWALAEMRTAASLGALKVALDGSTAEVEAATTMIQELLTAGVLTPQEGFTRISALAKSVDPRVRHHVLYGLAVFAPSDPLRGLLDAAAADTDPAVRQAAGEVRAQLREAQLRRLVRSVG